MGVVRQRTQLSVAHSPSSVTVHDTDGNTDTMQYYYKSTRSSPNSRLNPYIAPPRPHRALSLLVIFTLCFFVHLIVFAPELPNAQPMIPFLHSFNTEPRLRGQSSGDLFFRRVVYMDPDFQYNDGSFSPPRLLSVAVSPASVQDNWSPPHNDRCLPKAEWQVSSHPNCNTIHELDVPLLSTADDEQEESLAAIAEGWFRTTWRLDRLDESLVLKTLRIEREFLSEYYDLHRRDAVAMERLTGSPFVVNVYGYCGQSAINELADFPFPGVQNLEAFDKRMRGQDSDKAFSIKLRMAASIALGVADIHAAGANDDQVYMAHYDINIRNIALFSGGKPKLNDFNIAEFLRYDPVTNETCKFPSRLHEPWWRAPEEMNTTHAVMVDEKVDIYALGNVLYHTLTTHSSRGSQRRERMDEVRPLVAAGVRPVIPDFYREHPHPGARAIVRAIDMCYEKDPEQRASAEEVAAVLYEALLNSTDVAARLEQLSPSANDPPNDDGSDDEEGMVEDKDAMAAPTTT